jgi:hypothetical protein
VDAVLAHMNSDHRDDNLIIIRGLVDPSATSATMIGLDGDGGRWTYFAGGAAQEVTIAWSAPISERPQIRAEIVTLYDAAKAAASGAA